MLLRAGLTALLLPVAACAQSVRAPGWPARSHDNRRTGMSGSAGPGAGAAPFFYTALQGLTINISPTVDPAGKVYFGTWGMGVTPDDADPDDADPRYWDKFSGRLFSLDPAAGAFSPQWSSPLDFTPACTTGVFTDPVNFCPAGGYYNGYTGTVEGAGARGPDGTLYYGRGDGKLYAINPASGAVLRKALTLDPQQSGDPESGGEIIPAPLYGPDGRVYVATWGVEHSETSAVYAYDAATFAPLWRYPATGSLSAPYGVEPYGVIAAPALSPDGKTLYVAETFTLNAPAQPPRIYALRLDAPSEAQRLRWSFPSVDPADGTPLYVHALAVGSDGTLFVGAGGLAPVHAAVYAVRENGGIPGFAWPAGSEVVTINTRPANNSTSYNGFSLAMQEEYGATTRLYAASLVQSYITQFGYADGRLIALDPATGQMQWSFDPFADGGVAGSFGGLALGADGMIYAGITGAFPNLFQTAALLALWPDCPGACAPAARKNFSRLLGQYARWPIPALGPVPAAGLGAVYLGTADSDQACYDRKPAGYGGVINTFCTDGVNYVNPRLYGMASATAQRPAAIGTLRLAPQGAELALNWSPVTLSSTGVPITVAKYHVVRSTSADFPSLPQTVKLPGEPLAAAFTTATGDRADGNSYFYQVLALTPQGILGE